MSDQDDPVPPPDSPPLNGGRHGRPAPRQGANRSDAVPRMENVRVTAPDLARRAALEKTRSRLVITAGGFIVLFSAVLGKLALATIVMPLAPHRAERTVTQMVESIPRDPVEATLPGQRAMITDRNGQPMAISLPTVALYADPRQIGDPEEAATKLKSVLPRLDMDETVARLKRDKKFIYLAREITPREEQAINNLGIPGVDFQPTQHREYPLGRTAAQVLGGVDVDENGFAGVEKYFDRRLRTDTDPLRLSIDLQVQAVVREELSSAMAEFEAIGGCGIVMDVNTGEVLAMVSLPDYDANFVRTAPAEDRFNRAVEGTYEPGSTFKLQTASMALDGGMAHIWDEFDASRPIHIGRFTITDFEGKHRWLYLPEVLAYSSNLGAAHIALTVGAERQRAFLKTMGMFNRTGIQLPESALPIVQSAANWKEVVTMTVGFGHGISVTPLHIVRGTAAVATGELVRPTILARDPDQPVDETRVIQPSTNEIMRKLMRLVVTDGYGKAAEVAGYYPGGKTGTAEKVGVHGTYRKHTNVSAFISVFPMNAPRYAVYMMLDEPHGNKSTYGYSTAGWVVAPAAGKVIARIGPMLGMLPDIKDAATINQELSIPLQPARPPGAVALGPWSPPIPTETSAKTAGRKGRPDLTVPATILPPAISHPARIIRRETKDDRPTVRAVRVVSTAAPVAGR
ncbi:penicillin-binding protein 2 [Acidisphaera sp. S103]|uniref:peptidoglycan D,D-transpeptidase FtsI family protein n=1 Tax=Acidisphaera sp. S103 TaxID=1747223 RepID=UPI0020B164F1|nr:penicillin-binding protein 2 [Acidisphaera sp. S103]